MLIGETHIKMRAGEMIDNLHVINKLPEQIGIGDVATNRFQMRICRLMPQQVQVEVDRSYVMSMFKLAIHQVTADEATCTGDQYSHALSCFSAVTITALLVR